MNKFQYQISDKTDQQIWVCEACKKGHNELILTGKWKLIDRCNDSETLCTLCEGNKIDTESKSPAAKKGT